MNVLARHYVCFAGQLCGVSTDGTGFTAIVRRICVHVRVLSLPLHCLQLSFAKELPATRLVFCRCFPREFEKASPKITGERQSPRQRERACHGCRCKQAAVPARRSTHVDDLSVASRRASSPSHLNPSSLSHSTLLADAGCC